MRSRWSYIPILLSLWVSACTGGESPQSASLSPTYIKSVYSLPRTLDPIQMNDTASLMVSNLIYDGLLRFTPDLRFEGALAESWTVDQEGRRYVFKLRPGIRFHDGKPITAEAVVYSLTRAVAQNSTVYKYYDCIKGADEYFAGRARSVAGLKAEATDRVAIELKYPFPPFLSVLAGATAKVLPILSESDPAFFDRPIGSGAFQFVEMKRGKDGEGEMRLKGFNQYKPAAPKIMSLLLRGMSEADAMAAAASGVVHDLASFPLSGAEPVFKTGRDASTPVAATWIIGLNVRRPPFDQLKVRQAFKAAVDTEAFRRQFHPDAVPAAGYIPSRLPGYIARPSEQQRSLTNASTPKHSPITVAVPEVLSREKEIRDFFESSLRVGRNKSISS